MPRDYDLQGIEKRIIDKMIAIDPQGRYQDVKEIIKDLDQLFHIEKRKKRKSNILKLYRDLEVVSFGR